MVIKSAEFVISNSRVEKCPTTGLPEYAFIGRSNVGKSSLINMLTARKGAGYDFAEAWEDAAHQPLHHQ